jgi:Ca2+-binding RTX toxin-like protein
MVTWVNVLRTSNLLNDGTFQGHEFTLNGLDGDDTLIALNGSRNWPVFTVANPTELLVVTTYLNGGAGNHRLFSTVGFRDLGPVLGSNYGHSTSMYGGDGDDFVAGGVGNDVVKGGLGNDTLAGGAGDDYFGVDNIFDGVYEFASEGNDTVASGHIF